MSLCALAVAASAGASVTAMQACKRAPVSDVALSMSVPQGVLDDATSVVLYVFPADASACNADGSVGTLPEEAVQYGLAQEGCDGASWCGEITLEQSDISQMFYVEVADASGVLARGCTAKVVDQDPLEVDIKVVRFVEEACCGDGELQSTELCDNGGDPTCGGTTEDPICQSDCTTRPVLVDDDGTGAPKGVGQNSVSMVFAPGSGQLDGGLRLAWNYSTDTLDVALRVLQSDLSPVTDPDVLTTYHRLYPRCSGLDEHPIRDQLSPSLARQGSGAVLAYLSSEFAPQRNDAVVLTLNAKGCSDMLKALPVSNQTSSVDDIDIATGPSDQALIVWQQNGKIFGRTFDGTSLGAETITISDDGAAPRVAGSSAGWVVTYAGPGGGDEDGVLARRVDASLAVGDAILVNADTAGAQDEADVAATPDGSFAVVYRSAGDVFLQRFDASDKPLDEDRAGPVHLSPDGEQGSPSIAASSDGDFYVLAWQSGSTIRARFAGRASGFLANNVTAQNDDFEATAGTGAKAPKHPAVAAGGFVVIAWDDQSGTPPGIVARRLPLPR